MTAHQIEKLIEKLIKEGNTDITGNDGHLFNENSFGSDIAPADLIEKLNEEIELSYTTRENEKMYVNRDGETMTWDEVMENYVF